MVKPTRPTRARDRRVARTERALGDALITLMLERGWDGFSVQELCDRADVARSTFYLHFSDKDELLAAGFHHLRDALRVQLADAAAAGRTLGFARGLIDHIHDNQRLFRALVGKRSAHVVLVRFRDLVVELIDEDLAGAGVRAAARAPATRFIAGGLVELLTLWFEAPHRTPTPVEMERSFLALATPVIEAAAR